MEQAVDLELSLLREMIEFLPEAVAIFDADDRSVRWNRKYAEFYAEGAHLLVAGKSFETYLREFMSINQFPNSVGREEEWVAERMAPLLGVLTEETGLIDALGRQILQESCRFAASRPDVGQIAVNLSPAQFRNSNLVADVRSALLSSGLDPWRLEFKITESVLFDGSAGNMAALHAIGDLGVSIALDDFRTGYSSLSHLRSIPFDRIKMDRSFTRDMVERADCRAIVRAVLRLSESLAIAVTAEGIETEAQRQMQIADGCRYGQGYLFGHPTPANEIRAASCTKGTATGAAFLLRA